MSTPVTVITGASRGIGKRLAIDLAHAGWDVVCAARSSQDSPSKLPGTVDDTAAAVVREGRRAMPVALDVQDEDAVAALAERVYAEWGRCDLLDQQRRHRPAPARAAGLDPPLASSPSTSI